MSIGFILFLYNLFLCDIDSIYTMFFLILLVILYGPRVCNKRLNKQTIDGALPPPPPLKLAEMKKIKSRSQTNKIIDKIIRSIHYPIVKRNVS